MTEAEAIVHVEPRAAMAAAEPSAIERETGNILEVIARAAADPTVDVAKLERAQPARGSTGQAKRRPASARSGGTSIRQGSTA